MLKPTADTRWLRLAPLGLAALWAVMQVVFLLQNGIVTSLEATKYIYEAEQLLNTGKYSSGNFVFYSTQILLIAFCMKFNIGYWFIILLQILLNGLSVFCFYKILRSWTGNRKVVVFGTLYFLALYYYHLYNTFLYTESLFFSLSIIFTYVLFSVDRVNFRSIAPVILLLGLLYFTRPTGIFLVAAAYLFIVVRFFPKKGLKIILLTTIVAGTSLFFLVNLSLSSGGEFNFLLPYMEEHIICGVPTIPYKHDFSIPVRQNSLQGLVYIVTHHFDLFSRLAFKRLSAFFGVSRTFYSIPHNIFISVYYYVAYIIILYNFRKLFTKHQAEVVFLVTNIILMAITVMLSCDEWSNRFILSITPFIILLAIVGIINRRNGRQEPYR